MRPFQEALEIVLGQVRPLQKVESVPLTAAYGRVLAMDIAAREDIPVADNSAMDGYAVRTADLPDEASCRERPLRVVEVLAADHLASSALKSGEAMKIMTGAPIPPGADAVVMVEHTRLEGERVWIGKPPREGNHIRVAGGDMRKGEIALVKGTRLTPATVGMMAALGYADVPVLRAPQVGILATGDEIVEPTAPLTPGRVRNSNSYSLAGLVSQAGAVPHLMGIAPDSEESLKTSLQAGLAEHDVLITSGGVSMGDFDYVKRLVDEVGLKVHFRTINMKPGKPVVFGTRGEKLFFGLPGNPVSSMVVFLQLVRPALMKAMQQPDLGFRTLQAPIAEPFSKTDGKRHFLRGVLHPGPEGTLQVRLTGDQGSGLLHSMGRANCFVVIAEDTQRIEAGDAVTVQLFEGEPLPA
ncbi:MAG: molybdopterin molybdotransferase MoeA [SAR324 cluster bacterium]|nr:molybdopterin molybdotransferase MoeA [SAR324 cluster bacterium]